MITNFPIKPAYNPGGYSFFKFIPFNEVVVYPGTLGSKCLSGLQLLAGSSLYTGYATSETLTLSEKKERTDEGTAVMTTINGFAPGEKDELISLFTDMERYRFLVVLKDSKGKSRLVGSKLNPLQFRFDFSSGERRADGKGMTFQFYGTTRFHAPVYPF